MRAVPRIRGENGFTLLTVLVMIVVLGLALGLAGTTWKDVMQRAREKELFWRGNQYRRAIKGYYEAQKGAGLAAPAKLEDLVKDPRSLQVRRYLRHLYPDPMTGEEWVPVKDSQGRIVGVRSGSDLEPFQQGGFPADYQNFEGRTKYSEWEFIYKPERKPAGRTTGGKVAPQPGAPGAPGASGAPGAPATPATPAGQPPPARRSPLAPGPGQN